MASFTFNLPTREQVRASRNGNTMLSAIDSDSPRQKAIMIKGCPGSGKTTISVFRLMRLVSEKKRVTMLVYQHMLKTAIKNLSGGHRGHFNYCVHTLHSWYYYQTKEYYELFNQKDPSIPNADTLKQQLSQSNFANQNYYELLIDEGQDFHKSYINHFLIFLNGLLLEQMVLNNFMRIKERVSLRFKKYWRIMRSLIMMSKLFLYNLIIETLMKPIILLDNLYPMQSMQMMTLC